MKIVCFLFLFLVPIVLSAQQKPKILLGLPDHQVDLTGDPFAPTLVNNTARNIIAFSIRWEGGSSETASNFLAARHGSMTIVPAHGQQVVRPNSRTQVAGPDGRPIIPTGGAILNFVIFDDGEMVGPDTAENARAFDVLATRVKAEKDLHEKLLKDKVHGWEDVQKAKEKKNARSLDEDPRYLLFQASAAEELLMVREDGGEARALEIAKSSAKLPKIWRKP